MRVGNDACKNSTSIPSYNNVGFGQVKEKQTGRATILLFDRSNRVPRDTAAWGLKKSVSNVIMVHELGSVTNSLTGTSLSSKRLRSISLPSSLSLTETFCFFLFDGCMMAQQQSQIIKLKMLIRFHLLQDFLLFTCTKSDLKWEKKLSFVSYTFRLVLTATDCSKMRMRSLADI